MAKARYDCILDLAEKIKQDREIRRDDPVRRKFGTGFRERELLYRV